MSNIQEELEGMIHTTGRVITWWEVTVIKDNTVLCVTKLAPCYTHLEVEYYCRTRWNLPCRSTMKYITGGGCDDHFYFEKKSMTTPSVTIFNDIHKVTLLYKEINELEEKIFDVKCKLHGERYDQ